MSQYYNYKTSLFILFTSMIAYLVLNMGLFYNSSIMGNISQASQYILWGIFEILMIFPLILYMIGNAKSLKHEFRLRWLGKAGILQFILIGCGLFLVLQSIQYIIDIKCCTDIYLDHTMKVQTPFNYIFVIPLVAIITPLVEEAIFRGYLIKVMLNRKYPVYIAVLIQALLFTVVHLSLKQAPFILFAGIILGYIAYSFHSILPGIIIHSIFNVLVLLEVNISDIREVIVFSSIWIPIASLLIGAIVLVWSLIYLHKKVHVHRKRRAQIEE